MPLGFSRQQEYRALKLDLHPGDILFAYSDGITEAVNSEEELFGEERLMHLIRSSSELDAHALLEKVKQITFAYCAGAFRDDVTAIAVKIDPGVPQNDYAEEIFPQRMESMRLVREFVNRRVRSLTGSGTLSEERLMEIEIAVGEAVTNILRHQDQKADAELRASVVSNGEWLSVKLEYSGREYDWASYREPEIENYQESGYGLYLINTVMESLLVEEGEMDRQRLIMLTSLEDRHA
jgi:sigma-B regulation protein RsbU (phosphoserine phosphatase)